MRGLGRLLAYFDTCVYLLGRCRQCGSHRSHPRVTWKTLIAANKGECEVEGIYASVMAFAIAYARLMQRLMHWHWASLCRGPPGSPFNQDVRAH